MSLLHLIPCPIAENTLHTIPPYLHEIISRIKIWCVEDLKSARRYLKSVDKQINIDELTFYVINEHQQEALTALLQHIKNKEEIGLLSDAGCPAVADPGSALVAMAQQYDCRVVPHVGPNSLLLALMGSGFNGQHFKFNGYLPVKNPELGKAIKVLEQEVKLTNCTQLFIEAPYRNRQLLESLCNSCHPETMLCIAYNLTAENEFIVTKPIKFWKNNVPDFNKQPAVFVMGS